MICKDCPDKGTCDTKVPEDLATVAEHTELLSHVSGIWLAPHRSQWLEMFQRLLDAKTHSNKDKANAAALFLYLDSKEVYLSVIVKPKPAPTTETSDYGYTHQKGQNLEIACSILGTPQTVSKLDYFKKTLPLAGQAPWEISCVILDFLEDEQITTKEVAMYVTFRLDLLRHPGLPAALLADAGVIKGPGGHA